jgi:RNA polymerase sigma factor (sigma-70 family)
MPRAAGAERSAPLTDAQSRIVAENYPLALFHASRMTRLSPWRLEGARDAAIDGLINAARRFDPSRNRPFGAFAGICIYHEILAFFNKEGRKKRGSGWIEVQLDIDGLASRRDPNPFEFGREFESLVAGLEARDRDVLRMRYARGMKLESIGDRLGLTRQRVNQIQKRALRRLRQILEAEGHDRCA